MTAQPRTASLFPRIAIPRLARMHGRKWSRLVNRVADLPETHPEHLAYTLMIRRLAHLSGSNHASVCVMPGCVTCALDILERYDGSERDLIDEYHHTLDEVKAYLVSVEEIAIAA
jgi:hypothetical protein